MEYLNEEKYQKTVKKLKGVAKAILIIGILIGISLIVTGIVLIKTDKSTPISDLKSNTIEKIDPEEKKKLEKEFEEVKTEITKATDEIKSLKDELSNLESKKAEYMDNINNLPDMSQLQDVASQITTKSREIASKTSKELELEAKKNKIEVELKTIAAKEITNKSTSFDDNFTKIYRIGKYSWLFGLGGFIIFTSVVIFGFMYYIAKRREIAAFSMQQQMPIMKEATDELAPSARTISKEITKGVKEGLKDEENE